MNKLNAPNNGIVPDGDARQNDGTPANPTLSANAHRAAVFPTAFTDSRITRMVGGVDLHSRANVSPIANVHGANIQNAAIVVEETALADVGVLAWNGN